MSYASVQSRASNGMAAPAVTVEVHLANGLPSFTLVGLADTEVRESRERVRAALQNSGLEFPANRRITVSLAPADLPKESGRFDLPIALGILAASGQIDAAALAGHEFVGELSLAGDLRPVRGALAMSLAVGESRFVLPQASAPEAALAQQTQVYGAAHLLDVVQAFRPPSPDTPAPAAGWQRVTARFSAPDDTRLASAPDLRDVRGQADAKRALEIAAAGGHALLMVGPPGTGKSMLAQRLPGLLPPMTDQEALESAALLSVSSLGFDVARWRQRPYISPHHTASAVALVGGGSPPKPGDISLAHHGVLFLDELPETPRASLEALREPLEAGRITVSRAARQVVFPAQFQLVAAMNPCPCGCLGSTRKACRCTPDQVSRYRAKLSGPLLDRIDLQVEVPALAPDELLRLPEGEPSALVAERVAQARALQVARQGKPNARLEASGLDTLVVEDAARQFLQTAAQRLGWSARGTHRALKVARTVADLSAIGAPAGAAAHGGAITVAHVAEAIQLRRLMNG
jgi:magnesium chelatase family protein